MTRGMHADEDLLRFMSYRADVLEALEDRDMDKRDLACEADVSKSTVYKAVNRFQESGVVTRRVDGRYSLTLLGQFLLDQYRESVDVLDANSLLDVPLDETPLTPGLVKGGTFWVNSPESPYAALTKLEELFETITDLRIVCGHPSYRNLRHLRRQTEDSFEKLECIVERSYADRLRATESDALRQNVALSNHTYYEYDGVFEEIGMGVADAALYATFYNDHGQISGIMENNAPHAVEWGRETFQEFKNDATEIVASSL